MAWTPDGFWKPEENNAAQKVADVVNAGGPLMKQAAGAGLRSANSRGLANSSMAVGASQAETYRVAVPIGLQQSAQINQKNLAALNANENMRYGTTLQQMQDSAAKDRLGMQITSNEKLSANEINARMSELDKRIAGDLQLAREGNTAAMERLQADLSSRAQLQAQSLASQERLTMAELGSREKLTMAEIGSRENMQSQELAARMSELNTRIAGDMQLAQQGDTAAMARLERDLASREQLTAMELGSREKLSAAELASRAELQGNDIASRERLTTQEIGARMAELDKRIQSEFALAQQGDEAASARLEMDLAARAQLQAQSDLSTLERQREEITARADLSAAERASRLQELDKQIAGQAQIANMDIAARQRLVETEGSMAMDRATLDANTRLDIAGMDQTLQQSRLALDASANATNAYMQAMTASMANENIPAEVRAAYQASLEKATQANLSLVNQIAGTQLQWGSTPGPTNPATVNTGGVTPTGQPIMGVPAQNPYDQYGNLVTVGTDGQTYYGSPL